MKNERIGSGLLRQGVEQFNRGEFFECHETLEAIWLGASPTDKPFYQGLIQVAAAFHHHRNGNLRGARSLMLHGTGKLKTFPARHLGVDLESLLGMLEPWLRWLKEASSGTPPPLPRLRLED